MNILITGVGGPAGKALVNQLSTTTHSVVGVDMQTVVPTQLDSFELVPPASDPAMVEHLSRIISKYRIDMVIPTVADELVQIAHARSVGAFDPATVVLSEESAVHNCFDKLLTMIALRQAGVSVPPFGLPSDFRSAGEVFEALGPKIITKPRVARGGRGFAVHSDPKTFDLSAFDDSFLIQSFASGEEFAPMVYVGAQAGDETVALVRKQRESAGDSSAVVIQPVPVQKALDIAMLAVQACRALKLSGPIDLDVRRMADGRPVVLEVNARFGANSECAPEILQRVLCSYV